MSTPTKTTRVAIYTRISDDQSLEGRGVARQEELCRERVSREEGWTVVAVYAENDTGASTRTKKQRVQYPQMLAAAERGEFDVVLAYSNSRLTRRPLELESLIQLHERTGVRFCTIVSGDDDLSTADGRMMARIKASVDAAEAEKTGERLKVTQAKNRENGGQGTKRAFGWEQIYEKDAHGQLVLRAGKPVRLPDPLHSTEGKALKDGIAIILRGGSLAEVGRLWNGQGLTTTSGRPWTLSRVREVLTRPRNAGLLTHNGTVIGQGNWEPACTSDELTQLVAILDGNPARERGRVGRPAASLLSGLINCARCGRPMVGGKQKGGRPDADGWVRVYRCSGSQSLAGDKCWTTIRRDTAEAEVITRLVKRICASHPSSLPTSAETSRLGALYADLSALQAKRDRLVEAVMEGLLDAADVRSKKAALDKEQITIQAEVDLILRDNAELAIRSTLHARLWTPGKISFQDAVDARQEVREQFLGLSLEAQRNLARTLGLITVAGGRKDRLRFREDESMDDDVV